MLTKHYLKILQLYSIALIGIHTCVHWRITIRDEVHSSLQHVHSLLPVPSKVLENATVGPPLSSTGIVHDCPVLATSRALWSTWRRRKHVKTTRAIALRSTFKPLPSWTVQATNLNRAQQIWAQAKNWESWYCVPTQGHLFFLHPQIQIWHHIKRLLLIKWSNYKRLSQPTLDWECIADGQK